MNPEEVDQAVTHARKALEAVTYDECLEEARRYHRALERRFRELSAKVEAEGR